MSALRRFATATLAGLVTAAGAVTYTEMVAPDGAVAAGIESISNASLPAVSLPGLATPSSTPSPGTPTTGTLDPDEAEEAEQVQEVEDEPAKKPWDELDRDEVLEIQRLLVKAGALDATPNGTYGPATEAAVRKFQSARGLPVTGFAGPLTLAKLRGLGQGSSTIDPRCDVPGKVLCIDKSGRVLRAMENGKVVRTADARFGAAGMATREGVHKVYRKSRNHVSSIYNTPMPYALFFSGGQAVHYSADFAAKGYAGASHGCVNLRSKATAEALFDWADNGTKVVIYRSN